jgi:hypothetical protein
MAPYMGGLSAQGANHDVAGAKFLDDIAGWGAQGTDDQFDLRMRQCNLQQTAGTVWRHATATRHNFTLDAFTLVGRQWRNAFATENTFHEVAVDPWNEFLQIVQALFGFFIVSDGNDHIHAIGFAIGVSINPSQLGLELLGRNGGSTQNAEASGAGHFNDNIAAM